jgi:hypothetical protein
MTAMAEGRTSWVKPTIGGLPVDAAPLPYALGAVFVKVLSPAVDPSLAARMPFAMLLALVLALTWYAAFYLARTSAAQPVAFAFGGEAHPVDYARVMGDAALLALMSTLGLLWLGHETTPELAQLASTTLFLWGMAAAPFRRWQARLAMITALPMLAASGAPLLAVSLGAVLILIALKSGYAQVRDAMPWMVTATVLAALVGSGLGQWHWHLAGQFRLSSLTRSASLFAWFLWPAWLLAVWTLWRWRRQSLHRHIMVPLSVAVVTLVGSLWMNGSQRVLLVGLPAFAILAAFALPTLRRSTGAAIDWFSMFLLSGFALFVWIAYSSLQWGLPRWPANRVAALYQGFEPSFSWLALALALIGTAAWAALVRWRTGRHRSAIWKSLVIPAGGVALVWLLVMTLLLPLFDYVLGMRTWTDRLAGGVGRPTCIAAPGLAPAYVAALELHGRWPVNATQGLDQTPCDTAVLVTANEPSRVTPTGWQVVSRAQRPSDRREVTLVLKRR